MSFADTEASEVQKREATEAVKASEAARAGETTRAVEVASDAEPLEPMKLL